MIAFMVNLLIVALCIGICVSTIVFIPLMIYVIPYGLWVGFQNNKGLHKDKSKQSIFIAAKNASKLYLAWILGKEPTF